MGMSIDEIFAEVGELGRQQWKYLTLINILHIYFPFYMLQYTFVARNVDFYCNLNTSSLLDRVPSTLSENSLSSLGTTSSYLEDSFVTKLTQSSKFKYCPSTTQESCSFIFTEQRSMAASEILTSMVNKNLSQAYQKSGTNIYHSRTNSEDLGDDNVSTKRKKRPNFPDFVESHKHGQPSIVAEWELVCERAWLRPATMSSFMAGVLLGSLVLGSLSDKIGRKPTVIFTMVCMITSNAVGSFVHSFELYCFFRAVTGYFCGGHVLAMVVLYNEMIGSSKRAIAGAYGSFTFSIGIMIFSAVAYFIQHWRVLAQVQSGIGVLLLPIMLFVPESPRWLVAKQKYEQADHVIHKIVIGNGHKYKDKYRQTPPAQSLTELKVENDPEDLNLNSLGMSFKNESLEGGSVFTLFRFPSIRFMTMVAFYTWFVVGVGYYALTISASGPSNKSLYTSTILSAAVEIPGSCLAAFLLGYTRRVSLAGFFFVWGISGLFAPLFTAMGLEALRFSLAFFCKMCATACFTLVYINTQELFPTKIRNTVIGMTATCARVGGILAPFCAQLDHIFPDLNLIVLGMASLLAGILTFKAFPETCGQALPENLKDTLDMLENTKMWSLNSKHAERALDVKYSALGQDDADYNIKSNGQVGKENFDNVNFDYDDFSDEDDEVNLITNA